VAHASQNGGDLGAAAFAIANAQRPGAVLAIEVERSTLMRLRQEGLESEREGAYLLKTWGVLAAVLPSKTVGQRTSWLRFEFVLEGAANALGPLGRRLLAELEQDVELRVFDWHLIFTEIFAEEPERTFLCDPGYDLARARGRSVLAWVRPYAGPDWRASQRYPSVVFLTDER
jgi:hypothetical protein